MFLTLNVYFQTECPGRRHISEIRKPNANKKGGAGFRAFPSTCTDGVGAFVPDDIHPMGNLIFSLRSVSFDIDAPDAGNPDLLSEPLARRLIAPPLVEIRGEP